MRALDHVGIAVEDLDAAVDLYARVLGLETVHRGVVVSQGVEEVLLSAGDVYVQLLGALGPDTPVGRFLERRGPGVHHVGYRVADVASELDRLRGEGVPLVDEVPRPGPHGTTIAFLHPEGMGGVLVELVQETGSA